MISLLNTIFHLILVTVMLAGCSQTSGPLVSHKETPNYGNNSSQNSHKGLKKSMGHGLLEKTLNKYLVFSTASSEKNRRLLKLKPVNYYLIGASESLILEVFGQATFARVDSPAQILQFESEACFLDLFLYKRRDTFRVNHVSIRSKQVKKTKDHDCFSSLVSSHDK